MPQIQFILSLPDIPVVLQRRVPTVQTVQKTTKIPQARVQFWRLSTRPSLYNDRRRGAVSAAQLQCSGRWSMFLLSTSSRRCDWGYGGGGHGGGRGFSAVVGAHHTGDGFT